MSKSEMIAIKKHPKIRAIMKKRFFSKKKKKSKKAENYNI